MSFAARARSARAANDTTRAQINNIPEKSHVIPLLTLFIPGFFAPATGKAEGGGVGSPFYIFKTFHNTVTQDTHHFQLLGTT